MAAIRNAAAAILRLAGFSSAAARATLGLAKPRQDSRRHGSRILTRTTALDPAQHALDQFSAVAGFITRIAIGAGDAVADNSPGAMKESGSCGV
jgi:hypothetical protein